MKINLFFFCILSAFHGFAQNDVLVLEKRGQNLKSYAAGVEITMETIYHQWFTGTIEALLHDTVYINGLSFHYREIASIRLEHKKLNFASDGSLLMVAGGGVLFLGAVNGIYRKDKAKDWYTPVSFITAGSLLILGILLKLSQYGHYNIGKKYTLQYLALSADKK